MAEDGTPVREDMVVTSGEAIVDMAVDFDGTNFGIVWAAEAGAIYYAVLDPMLTRLFGLSEIDAAAASPAPRVVSVASQLASTPVLAAAADASGRWFAAYAAEPMASCCTVYAAHICPM